MKTKNNLTTGILIGIGVIVLPLILMGTTNTTSSDEIGTFELVIDPNESLNNRLYRINTKTGETKYYSDYLDTWRTK